ncbi:hypothetical protein BDP27DRAFT_1193197, partial [Rhodocollybia butyracea]
LQKYISSRKWAALAYVCNDLNHFPGDKRKKLSLLPVLRKRDISKNAMAEALISWRINDVEKAQFAWSHFMPTKSELPEIPWAELNAQHENIQLMNKLQNLTPQNRADLLAELTARLNYKSTCDIGAIHGHLTQPVVNQKGKPIGNLAQTLERMSVSALAFVCIDLNRLLVGNFGKAELIEELVSW